MDEMEAEYNNYWETKRFYEEIDSWGFDAAISSNYDSSSPDGAAFSSPPAAQSIEMMRKRRRKLNDSLYALRSVVPNITKMDKVSILKDAIDYIQELQKEEKRMIAEIDELESDKKERISVSEITQDDDPAFNKNENKRSRRSSLLSPGSPGTSPIQVLELRVCEVGDRTLVISITCNKKSDTMIKVCELFESLNLNIISSNITSVSGSILQTLFVDEGDEMNNLQLKQKIEATIAGYDAIISPTSSISY